MAPSETTAGVGNSRGRPPLEGDWQEDLRAQFPICDRAAYFQTGTLCPLAGPVRDAVDGCLDQEGDAGLTGSAALAAMFADAEAARARLASFLGARPEQIAWTSNTSLAIRYVLDATPWQPGDRILTTDTEHVGTRSALAALTERHGVEPVVVPAGRDTDEVLGRLEQALREPDRIRLLFLSQVSCQDGRCLPVHEAVERAHRAGVAVAIDGAQSAGQLPVDLARLGCDYFVGSGHKWLLGPHGIGYLYVRDEAGYWPAFSLVPRPASEDVTGADAIPLRRRIEIGTESLALRAGLDAALRLLDAAGLERIGRHVRGLRRTLVEGLGEIPGVEVLAPRYGAEASGIVAFRVDGYDLGALQRAVDALWESASVVVKAQQDSAAIRVSLAGFNTGDEVARLIAAIPAALGRVG
ncbi:MAG TPA: aminotransferase class V-fold PLP-dependent enzyme [Thermomicrobiaceae bacterium]|nr:aminotransferase class V-fold PLP-dependent enzyme [Thermomicrobiaceae bacterium]